jgi:O-acetylhomoserine/O-acetylserine sulfhydrylase-like pyridoxal-dependent enzyme
MYFVADVMSTMTSKDPEFLYKEIVQILHQPGAVSSPIDKWTYACKSFVKTETVLEKWQYYWRNTERVLTHLGDTNDNEKSIYASSEDDRISDMEPLS